ncbi:PH domain-containing protein [Dietzia sp. ANT_WB102]|uniref:PH domain-containing protein n=1 Tax=Dietzia sp. ANT_WB102 TaxID=2597345 RepID=UPI0011ECC902|nr:PH domain-containing protein [Dietzia sp. ANT_WB102]KAA0918243.1 PH domain-containing protein [Dietzia sp. ANT_WB102]
MSGDAVSGAGARAASWSPGALWPAVQIAAGIALVAVGLQRQDPLAMLLTGLAALFLIPAGTSQLLRRPRLEVVDGQLAIKKLGRVVFVPKSAVVEVRALGVARWGARQQLMRLEYTDERGREQLDVYTRLDLGTDPRDVVAALHRLGFGAVDRPS